MRILHVPFCYYPDPAGGTEVYVRSLAAAQKELGAEPIIAAPGQASGCYQVDGIQVHRFPVARELTLRQLYGEGDPVAARSFADVIASARPQIVHLHAFTAAVSVQVATAAKNAGAPVVFTYHTPTVSCQRGTLLRWGTDLCDGRLDLRTCTACYLQAQGLRRSLAIAAAHIPSSIGNVIGAHGLSGGLWTAVRMAELVEVRHKAVRRLIDTADRIVSLCSWVTDVLRINGVPTEKIELCCHGLRIPEKLSPVAPKTRAGYRLVFLGRIDPTKGLDVLLKAITAAPELKITLDIYGVLQGPGETPYQRKLLATSDSRIWWHDPIPTEEVISRLSEYDGLVVPSQWLETGPLVVLEAFAAGLPVIGSDLGGIRELVRHEVDGLLVPPNDVVAWTKALRRVAEEPGLLDRLRAGLRLPRTIQSVAAQMLELYGNLLAEKEPIPECAGVSSRHTNTL